MNKYLSKIVGAVASLALVIGVGFGIANDKKATELNADNDISISETTTGTSYAGTNFVLSSGGATASGYYKLGSSSLTTKSSYSIDSTKTVSYSITTRKFGGPSAAEAVVNLTLMNGSTVVGSASYSPTDTSLTEYPGTFTITGDTSNVKFVIKGNGTSGGGRGVGISSITFTATSLVDPSARYSVTYHDTNKTSGSVPIDANTYETSDPVTIAGNTGSLVRTGYTWSGWSLYEDGSGTAYGPAYTTTLTVATANINLYPIWVKNITPLPSSGKFSISGTNPNFGSYGTNVAYTIEEDDTADTAFGLKATDIMKNSGNMQFKASSGVLYSTTPLSYIRSVVVSGANNGDAVIRYGTSENSGCTEENIGLRSTYFKVSNGAAAARYWTITVTYSIVDPASLTDLVIASGLESVKKVYDQGEVFDPTGLVIQAEWNDVLDTEHNVVNDVVWSPNPLTAGTTSVTGTYTHATGTETVTVTGLTVKAPDAVIDANSNTPAGIGEDTSTTAVGEGKINSTGVNYGYYALAVNDYNDVRNLEFNRSVSNAYLGNNESYGKYIRKIRITLTFDGFSKFTMYKGDSAIPGTTEVAPSGTGTVRVYDFGNNSEYFALKLTTTGTWVNISKIEIFLGSNVPVIDGVSASIKAGTYYAGTRLSASDFNVVVSWTEGKANTNPTEGFTWTVNGVENGYLEEKSNNKVVVTYCGEDSAEFDVVGSPAPAKDIIESTLETQSSLTYHYSKDYHVTTDVINREFTTVPSDTNYVSWNSKTGTSGTVYAGNTAGKDGTVQLNNSGSNKGIIVTSSVGIVKSVSVVWNSDTNNDRVVDIYGKNAAYASVADAFDTEENGAAGTLIGSITKGTSTRVNIDGSYSYIAIRSRSGAMYFDSISIDWAVGSPSFSYSNVGVRFTGRIDATLWNTLNTQSTIEGYGIMYAETSQLAGSEIEEWYDLARASAANVDASFTAVAGKSYKMVNDSEVMCYYTAVPGEKEHPAQVGDEYVWSLFKSIDTSNPSTAEANLAKQYTAVAYIRTTSDEIIFLDEITRSAADVALELYLADASLDDTLNGSLSDLANMA